jgi:peptidoglycan/xylan/chitin deacetylase (PgdA/CDA1 family)
MLFKTYPVRTPLWLKWFYPGFEWQKKGAAGELYLTFDDGPHPEITGWVMDQLEAYGFQASFFLIGDNIRKYPDMFEQLKKSGHSLGSHTMKHLNGWKSRTSEYLQSFNEADELVETELFRPPYGRIKPQQARQIRASHRIIMWDVLSGDFDLSLTPEKCAQNVIKNIREGSIVVFHDSEKAWPRLKKALPAVLQYMHQQGLYSVGL